ncbi:MAG: 7TM-DISM domain-containing protein [Moraxellaceae bacterium]
MRAAGPLCLLRHAFAVFTVLSALLVWPLAAQAGTVVFRVDDRGTVLNADLEILRDPGGHLNVDEVARSTQFHPGRWHDFTPGYTTDAIWLRLSFYNSFPDDGERYLEISPPRLQDVRLYQPLVNGSWQLQQGGTVLPVAEREVASRLTVFPLRMGPGETRTVYVRIASANAIMLHARLWQPQAFHQAERRLDLINSMQYGAVLLLFIYGLVLAYTTRERALLYFGLMLGGALLNDVSLLQYAYQYLWPHAPDWNLRSPGVFGVPVLLGSALLIMRLLDVPQYFPRSRFVLLILCGLLLLTVPPMLWGDYRFWVTVSYALTLLCVIFIGAIVIRAAWRRLPEANLVLQAFVLTWLLTLLRLGQIFGLVPHDILIDYSQNWAILLSGSVIVIIIVDMLRKLREEREVAEIEAVAARLQAEQDVRMHTHELRLAKEMAEASSHAKSAFLAQLSHELRTPLHSILGYSGLILGESTNVSDRRRVAAVQQSGRHLLALIDELLDYARLEANKLTLEPRPVYLHALLEAVVQEVRQGQVQEIPLGLQLEPGLPSTVMLDPVRLRQVLLNLMVNACRHSRASRITLIAAPGQRPDSLYLAVQDNGSGIAPEDKARLFLPFEQGRAPSEGMGLGLAISQQFVQLMGGDLVCEDAAGGGSIFHFSIALEEAPEAQVQLLAGEVMPRRYRGAVRRVLVVDDIAENRALLADVLATLGFDVALADGGSSALSCLAEPAFDLVITDQLMPDMSGWELLRRAREAGHAMPFILLSGAAPVLPDNWPPRLVFAVILMKPAEPARLAEAIASALRLEWEEEAAPATQALFRRPPEDDLRQLREAASEGRISDIEDWASRLLQAPAEYHPFALAVQEAVRRLDLPGIQSLSAP